MRGSNGVAFKEGAMKSVRICSRHEFTIFGCYLPYLVRVALLGVSWLLLPLWEPPGWPGVSGCLLDASWVPLGCLLGGSWVSPGCLLAASWACPGWLLVNPPQDYLAACSRIANAPAVWGLTLESYQRLGGVRAARAFPP
jgi:hypothetical protein